jgi:Effector-associated domain 10/LGFP repeat
MSTPDRLQAIFERIANHQQTAEDLDILRQSLRQEGKVLQWVSQDGKFNTNVGEIVGGEVHLGDRIYHGTDAETIRLIVREELGIKAGNYSSVNVLASGSRSTRVNESILNSTVVNGDGNTVITNNLKPIVLTVVCGVALVGFMLAILIGKVPTAQTQQPSPIPISIPTSFIVGSDGNNKLRSFIESYRAQGGALKLGDPSDLRKPWQNPQGEGGYIQRFSGGSEDEGSLIFSTTNDKTFWVGSNFWRNFQLAQGIDGILAYPTSDRYLTKDSGWRQDFKGGAILQSSRGTFAVWGGVGGHYLKTEGGENGRLGFPTSRELGVGGGIKVHHFQNGCIRYDDNGSPTRTIMLQKEMLGNDDRCKNG